MNHNELNKLLCCICMALNCAVALVSLHHWQLSPDNGYGVAAFGFGLLTLGKVKDLFLWEHESGVSE